MDETDDIGTTPAGEQLRAAREAKGLSLEDIASQTRIPRRHLESIENSDWSRMPAQTYSIGFAKSFATVVGLDRVAIGDKLRAEMGGARPATATAAEVFEPSDPARTMPKWLVFGAIAAVLALVLVMSWLNSRSLADDSAPAADAPVAEAPAGTPAPAPATAAGAQGPVVITANEQVWIQVKDGASIIKAGLLESGQSFEVPASAKAPVLTTGKPEAIRISVGTADAPPVGPAAMKVSNVSLLGPDLLRGPAAAATPPAATTPPAAQ